MPKQALASSRMLHTRATEALIRRLDAYCAASYRNRSQVILMALEQYLATCEPPRAPAHDPRQVELFPLHDQAADDAPARKG